MLRESGRRRPQARGANSISTTLNHQYIKLVTSSSCAPREGCAKMGFWAMPLLLSCQSVTKSFGARPSVRGYFALHLRRRPARIDRSERLRQVDAAADSGGRGTRRTRVQTPSRKLAKLGYVAQEVDVPASTYPYCRFCRQAVSARGREPRAFQACSDRPDSRMAMRRRRRFPADGSGAWRSRASCVKQPDVCCSMSRPIIWIWKEFCGWKSCSRLRRSPAWS